MLKRLAIVFAAMTLLALAVGCSKAPEAEMQGAQAAMDAAKAAEAEVYVPDSYRAAVDAMNAAQAAKTEQDSKFALFRSYGKSKDMFVSAEGMFNNVTSEAAEAKERVRVEVTQMLVDAKAVVDSTAMALKKAPRGKGSAADLELIGADVTSVQTALTEAETDFNEGRYMVAKTKLENVMQKAREIREELMNAAARKKAGS